MIKKLLEILKDQNIIYEKNVSLKEKTWLKRGGTAKLWIQPENKDMLLFIIRFLYDNHINFEIVGNTSNCYFTENYDPIVIISTLKVCDFEINNGTLICGCGYNLKKLSKFCIENGIAGYEGFIGIPGTVGGAAINNSGARGYVISQVVTRVEIVTTSGKIKWIGNNQLGYKHRYSTLKSLRVKGTVLSVEFDISRRDDKSVMLKKAENYLIHRRVNQENKYLNLGSIFSELDLFKNKRSLRFKLFTISKRVTRKLFKNKSKFFEKNMLFILFGKFSMAKNVSNKDINCFVWKNINLSDNIFFDYINFLKNISTKAILEVEIKHDNNLMSENENFKINY